MCWKCYCSKSAMLRKCLLNKMIRISCDNNCHLIANSVHTKTHSHSLPCVRCSFGKLLNNKFRFEKNAIARCHIETSNGKEWKKRKVKKMVWKNGFSHLVRTCMSRKLHSCCNKRRTPQTVKSTSWWCVLAANFHSKLYVLTGDPLWGNEPKSWYVAQAKTQCFGRIWMKMNISCLLCPTER